jgi:hypothetical protein
VGSVELVVAPLAGQASREKKKRPRRPRSSQQTTRKSTAPRTSGQGTLFSPPTPREKTP